MTTKRTIRLATGLALVLTASLLVLAVCHHRPASNYQSPLDIFPQLAADFGELREDHFHMGVDIRTRGREGLPVYAVADGYVSHIRIEESGLGKALFITHPDGYTSVYGHLSRLDDDLEKEVHRQQYLTRSWEQDIDLPRDSFPVRQGQLIAYSGNTGASQAPHLHFEVHDSMGRSINPLLSALTIDDDRPPVIRGLYWYDRRYSTYQVRAQKIALEEKNNRNGLLRDLVTVGSPVVSLGITATDKSDHSDHLSNIFRAELWCDDTLLHSFRLSGFPDSDTRYINACIDYPKWIRSGIYVQHLSTLPGNRLPIFTGRDGLIHLEDGRVHTVRIRVSDIYDNASEIRCRMQYRPVASVTLVSVSRDVRLLAPGKANTVSGPSFRTSFSPEAFYDRVPFRAVETPATSSGSASPVVHLHDATIPVHDVYQVAIRTSLPPTSRLRDRTIIQLTSGDYRQVKKGKWSGDWMSSTFNRLGDLQLLVDTSAPFIELIDIPGGLGIRASDNLGRVARFRATLDGHWLCFARRNDLFTYTFDEYCPPGRHQLVVTAGDVAGNESSYTYIFKR